MSLICFYSMQGGGESLEQLYIRAQSAMEEIAEKHHGQRVVVVSHGGILRSLHIIATGLPSRGKVLNASINTFRISDTKDWTMCSFGDVQHLQDVGYLSSAFGGDQESG
jgi:probable phosphoglycerate mutase